MAVLLHKQMKIFVRACINYGNISRNFIWLKLFQSIQSNMPTIIVIHDCVNRIRINKTTDMNHLIDSKKIGTCFHYGPILRNYENEM